MINSENDESICYFSNRSDELIAQAKDNLKTIYEISDSIKEYLENMQQIVENMNEQKTKMQTELDKRSV